MDIDNIIRAKFAYLPSRIRGMEVEQYDHILRIDSGLASDMFNIACCTGEATGPSIEMALLRFQEGAVPYCWWVGFDNEPSDLTFILETLGLQRSEEELVMTASLLHFRGIVPPVGVEISRMHSVQEVVRVMRELMPTEEMQAISDFFGEAEELLSHWDSSLLFLIGRVEGQPVSVSSLFMGGGGASIFDVMVVPSRRGLGLGKAMTLAAMEEASRRGYPEVLLTATDDAKFLYEKIGFTPVKPMAVYTPR